MALIHARCGGQVSVWTGKCRKCHKKWSPLVNFKFPPPEDLILIIPSVNMPTIKKGKTDYAKWGDKADKVVPGVTTFASRLPNWPRWARITVTLVFVAILLGIAYLVFWR